MPMLLVNFLVQINFLVLVIKGMLEMAPIVLVSISKICREFLEFFEQFDLVLRPSEILLETRSARSKIWLFKLARSIEPPLGLSYRYRDQV